MNFAAGNQEDVYAIEIRDLWLFLALAIWQGCGGELAHSEKCYKLYKINLTKLTKSNDATEDKGEKYIFLGDVERLLDVV